MIFNFTLDYHCTWHGRHFIGHHDEEEYNPERVDKTLYLCIVRDPVDWVDSLFKRLHHIPEENRKSIQAFMNNEFYSVYEEGEKKGTEIMEDRHIWTKQRYANIFELRKTKIDYMRYVVPEKAKYTYFVRYEDLRDRYDETLAKIAEKFGLKRKNEEKWFPVPKIKGTYNALYEKKPILLTPEVQEKIRSRCKDEDLTSL